MDEATRAAAATLPPSFPIVWRGSTGYEEARVGRVFNQRQPARFPVAVVEATSAAHVAETVRLARRLGCRVAVRSGGHSWAAWSVRDGALLLDLGALHEVHLDAATGVVAASPSTTGRLLNALLAPHGRFFPGGHCPEVALGGFLLQGGMGWNCANWGWACERVVAVDVVTADGRALRCDAATHGDLFWAARGAGPGFPAIVTRFHLQTLPVFTHMRSSAYIYPAAAYRGVFSWALALARTVGPAVELVLVARHFAHLEGVHLMVLLLAFENDEARARAALQGAADSAPAGAADGWFAKATSLPQEYDDQHAANPRRHRYAADNCYVRADADVVGVLEPAFTTLPSKKSFSLWYSMHRAAADDGSDAAALAGSAPPPDMAVSLQTDHYVASYAVWEAADEDAGCQAWVRRVYGALAPHGAGSYLGDADFQERQARFWGAEQGARLRAVRRAWDPEGVVAGYLDAGDASGVAGLPNVHDWEVGAGSRVQGQT